MRAAALPVGRTCISREPGWTRLKQTKSGWTRLKAKTGWTRLNLTKPGRTKQNGGTRRNQAGPGWNRLTRTVAVDGKLCKKTQGISDAKVDFARSF